MALPSNSIDMWVSLLALLTQFIELVRVLIKRG